MFRRRPRALEERDVAGPHPGAPPPEVTPDRDLPPTVAATTESVDGNLRRLEEIVRGLQHAMVQLNLRVEQLGDARRGGSAPDPGAALPEPEPADVQAYLLGSFHLFVGGAAVQTWRSKKAASLLKYLLMHRDRTVRRETLMDVFWPSSSAKAARNNLNVTIYQLRGILSEHDPSGGHIVFRDGCYHLDRSLTAWVDAEAYGQRVVAGRNAQQAGETWAALAAFERARELYRGPLLEGEDGEWFFELQERFDMEHCMMLEGLAAGLLQLGDTEVALERAEEVLHVDPCRESAHQIIMRGYAVLEQPQLVARQYQRCRDLLRRELAVDPMPATTALYRDLVPMS